LVTIIIIKLSMTPIVSLQLNTSTKKFLYNNKQINLKLACILWEQQLIIIEHHIVQLQIENSIEQVGRIQPIIVDDVSDSRMN